MSPNDWSEMLTEYQGFDVPEGTLQDAAAISIQHWIGDPDGDGDYNESMDVVRFAPYRMSEPDRVDWDWGNNVRIELRLEANIVKL